MADSHRRVVELRQEAGIAREPESPERREARLNAIQLESLGSDRRNRISTDEYRADRRTQVHWTKLEELRRSNISGTQEHLVSQNIQDKLSSWNNAWTTLENDGAVEEDLGDINHGQTHRAKLMEEQSHQTYDEGRSSNYRAGKNPAYVAHTRGGARGGRGGGVIGSRPSRVSPSSVRRIPTGLPSVRRHTSSVDPGPSIESAHTLRHHKELARPKQEKYVSPKEAPAQRMARPPRTESWENKLASPEAFAAAFRKGFSQPASSTIEEATAKAHPSASAAPVNIPSKASTILTQSNTPKEVAISATPEDLLPDMAPIVREAASPSSGQPDLLIDYASSEYHDEVPRPSKFGKPAPSYSGDLLDLEMLSGPQEAIKGKGKEKATTSFPSFPSSSVPRSTFRQTESHLPATSNSMEFFSAQIPHLEPSRSVALPSSSSNASDEYQERIMNKSPMEEVHSSQRQRTSSNVIFGRHLMPGHMKEHNRADDDLRALSTTSPDFASSSITVRSREAPKSGAASSRDLGEKMGDIFATDNPFARPMAPPMVPLMIQPKPTSESRGIIGSAVHKPAFLRSTVPGHIAPLALAAEKPREAVKLDHTESRHPTKQEEEEEDSDEDPLAKITTTVHMPSGPSRFSSLQGFGRSADAKRR